MAHVACLAAARHALLEKRGWNVEERGLHGALRIRSISSDRRHGSIDRAVRMLGFGTASVAYLSDIAGLAFALHASTPAIVLLAPIERCCMHAHRLVTEIARLPGAELLSGRIVNQGLVRFLDPHGEDHDRRTDDVIGAIYRSGEAFSTGTTWQSRRAMRVSVCNWRTTDGDADRTFGMRKKGDWRTISDMSTTATPMTVDEFLKLPEVEGGKMELIHGEVVSMANAGFVHESVKSNLIDVLSAWLRQHRIGKLYAETAYRLGSDALAPGLSVLRNERHTPVTRDLPLGAPDLAIEVVSSETAARLRTKIRLYFEYGCKAVWIVYPEERLIGVHRAIDQVTILGQDQILEDLSVLPGFSTPVNAIFEGL
jgi:Uma2 family endonuclease